MNIKLANTTATPVELHLTTDVVIVGAHDAVLVTDDDAATGQVIALCQQGILVAHHLPEDPSRQSRPPRPRSRSTSGRRGKK